MDNIKKKTVFISRLKKLLLKMKVTTTKLRALSKALNCASFCLINIKYSDLVD